MAQSRHAKARMSQRGIRSDMVELVSQFGAVEGDRLVLDCRQLDLLVAELRRIERTALKVRDKGGVVVIEAGGTLVTTYNCNSYDRRAARRRVSEVRH